MGQDVKFVHLLSNTQKHAACFHPRDKCFHIYVFHFLCVCIQNRVNELLLYIYTLFDLVTPCVFLADTKPNEYDFGPCRLQEYNPKGGTMIIIIVSNNDGEYRQILQHRKTTSICDPCTRWKSPVRFELRARLFLGERES